MSLPTTFIPMGEWLPDLGDLNNPGLLRCEDLIPTVNGYQSLQDLARISNVGSNLQVIASHGLHAEDSFAFCATEDALFRQSEQGVWQDVSKSSDASYDVTDQWAFASFGNNIIAVSPTNPPQIRDGTIDNTTSRTTRFTDLITTGRLDVDTQPVEGARAIATVRDFVVMGNITNVGEHYIQWSAFNNANLWTPSIALQSDRQPLFGNGGEIKAIVGGQDGWVFRENSIMRMRYVGPSTVFQIDEVAVNRGTPAPASVVRLDNRIFYWDHAGFYQVDTRNLSFIPIGYNKVDGYVRDNSTSIGLRRMSAAIDPVHKRVLWSIYSDPTARQSDFILAYSYELGKWSRINNRVTHLGLLPTPGYHLDNIDTVLGDGIDRDSILVDSPLFSGEPFNLVCFTANGNANTFSGDDKDAIIETSWMPAKDRMKLYTTLQRLYASFGTQSRCHCEVGFRDRSESGTSYTQPFSSELGRSSMYVKRRAEFLNFRMTLEGGFKSLTALEVAMKSV